MMVGCLSKAAGMNWKGLSFNLIINARDAMDKRGEIGITTCEKEWERAPHILLEVSDQGCGIPEDVLENIFDPFFTTKELGKGTTFQLYFPGVREIRD